MTTKKTSRTLAFSSLGLSALLFLRLRSVVGPLLTTLMMAIKLLVAALASLSALGGALSAALGLAQGEPLAFLAGGAGAALATHYIHGTTRRHQSYARAFGLDWRTRLPTDLPSSRMPGPRLAWHTPRWHRNVIFWTLPASEGYRDLLCDLWLPPRGAPRSGLAFIYFHGGGWTALDKNMFTRPFFRHLTSQGHVVMDVAYRMYPETDMVAMTGDCRRAVVWMKMHAARFGVDPARVVLAGGSAGGHLALLTAYTPTHPDLTPDELAGLDTSVRAAIAFYPPVDLRAYRAYNPRSGVARILGGTPAEIPAIYDRLSPLHQVTPACPPTLLLHGTHDRVVPIEPVRALNRRLEEAGVPTVFVAFPKNEHGFDLFLPQISPAAQAAWHDVDRFLALVA